MGTTAIIGFGCAGYHAAKALREAAPSERIDVFSDTEDVPANPMLTTYYVSGKIGRDTVFPFSGKEEIAVELGLHFIENSAVKKLHAADRLVVTSDGRERRYDNVLIATGSSPLVPPIPGLPEKNIYVMRTPRDADALLAALERGVSSALVIGASWVGIKVAEDLYAYRVPMVMADLAPRIFPTATLPEVAEIIHARLEKLSIGLKFGSGISSMREEEDGIVSAFADGTEIKSGIVVLCMGLRAAVGFLDRNEIEIGRGIRVDLGMRTSVPHIYAAGDCSEAWELMTDGPLPVNLWANAVLQGKVAGRNIAGFDEEYQGNFIHNITHFFDMDFIGLGDNRAQGEQISFLHPTEGWLFLVVMRDGKPACINILDNNRLSGPAKAALIKRITAPGDDIGRWPGWL
jgi:NADPH-dependent 2,4-dienoyl-CoA reductase/sulfur reductase-like enzyme